jgi:transcriptional regulator with XRE-family HTH domain
MWTKTVKNVLDGYSQGRSQNACDVLYFQQNIFGRNHNMAFADRLSTLRQSHRLTQHELAQKVGIGISQMRRYEKGSSSPTLEVIRNIALTLGISADELIFDDNETVTRRKIIDRELLEQFESVSHLPPHDLDAVKTVLESIIVKNRVEEIVPPKKDTSWENRMRDALSKFRARAAHLSEEEIEDLVNEAVTEVRAEERGKRLET